MIDDESPVVSGVSEIIWQDENLIRPTHLAAVNDSMIAIADVHHIHLVTTGGRKLTMLGGEGRGPGEFGQIGGLGVWSPDTLLVWDNQIMRMTWLDVSGEVGRTELMYPPLLYTSPNSIGVVRNGDQVVLAWGEGITRTDGVSTEVVLVRHSVANPSENTIIARVPAMPMTLAGSGVALPATLFGPRPLYAVSPRGDVVATSGGDEPCVLFTDRISGSQRTACFKWNPVPMSASLRQPDTEVLKGLAGFGERQRDLLRARLEVQQIPDVLHHIESMLFAEDGTLWVRRVTDAIQYDSMLRGQYPELRPENYRWETIDVRGNSKGALLVDSRLTPLLITDDYIWGIYELGLGEPAVARMSRPN